MPINQLLGGRYQVIKCLGSGSHGKTYLAGDTYRPSCPKCVVRQLYLVSQSPRAAKFTLLLLKKKAEVLRQIGSPEQLSEILAHFEDEHSFYWVENAVQGLSLRDILAQRRSLPEAAIVQLMQDVLQGLVVLHSRGAIHRGIKADTIIRRQSDGRFVLTGFGVFETIVEGDRPYLKPSLSREDATLEPPNESLEQGFRSDIKALGRLALQALSSIQAESNAAIAAAGTADALADSAAQATQPARLKPRRGLTTILERMTHSNVEYGYQSAAEVLEDLRGLKARSLTIPDSSERPSAQSFKVSLGAAQRSRFWRMGNRWGVSLAVAVCLLGPISTRLPQRLLAHYWLSQASSTVDQGEYLQAIALSTRAIQQGDRSGSAYLQRGLAQYHLSNWDAAQADLTRALAIAPHLGQAFYYRGGARNALGDRQGALADYTQALTLASNPTEVYLKRGSVRASLGDSQGAIADYTQAIEHQPSSADAYSQRCLAYSDAGEHQKGLQDCSQAIDLTPGAVTAYQNRGLIRQRLGDSEGAIADLEIALRLDPQNADTYYTRGVIRLEGADEAGAIADFTQAIAIAPSHDLAYYERGIIKKQTGDLAGAKRDLEQAVTLCLEQGRYGCYRAAQAELAQPPLTRPSQSTQTSPNLLEEPSEI